MNLPKHIAIIMDGNGRWAKQRGLPRESGHIAGREAVKVTLEFCAKKQIQILTLFAFGQENWRRPQAEIDHLFDLFLSALDKETTLLNKHNVRLRIIGNRKELSTKLQKHISDSETATVNNDGMQLVVAINYSGRWDITNALKRLVRQVENGLLSSEKINEKLIEGHLSIADLPSPDLLIRTSGEQRLSNFMLWQCAYTEYYFTDIFWPDFNQSELVKALNFYATRERRFGLTTDQLMADDS